MDKRDETILNKILGEITYLESLTEMETYDEFEKDEKTKRATAMTLINIGELANHLSQEFMYR